MSPGLRPRAFWLVAALFVAVVVVPAAVSLSQGRGTICVASSTCALSAINPCVRHPSFAVVGRCALPLQ